MKKKVLIPIVLCIILLIISIGGNLWLWTSLNQANSEITSLETTVSTKNSEIEALESEVTTLQTDKSQFESQMASLQKDKSSLQTWLDGNITNYESQLTDKDVQINSLNTQISDVEEDYAEQQSKYQQLNWTYYQLVDNYTKLEDLYNEVSQDYKELNQSYTLLLNTLNIIDAKNLSRTEIFELPIGETLTYEYDVGYGIMWIVEISLSSHDGTRFECYIDWRQGEQGGIVSGSAVTIQQSLSNINGTVSTEIFDEGDNLFIRTHVSTNVSMFNKSGSARFSKAS